MQLPLLRGQYFRLWWFAKAEPVPTQPRQYRFIILCSTILHLCFRLGLRFCCWSNSLRDPDCHCDGQHLRYTHAQTRQEGIAQLGTRQEATLSIQQEGYAMILSRSRAVSRLYLDDS